MNLDEVRRHMAQRDRWDILSDEERHLVYLALADDVPDLVAEVERLNLQIKELKKTICASICGVDFPGFAAGEHMLECPLRTPCQRAHTPTSIYGLYEDGIRSVQCGNCDTQIPLLPPAIPISRLEECSGILTNLGPGEEMCSACRNPKAKGTLCQCQFFGPGALD